MFLQEGISLLSNTQVDLIAEPKGLIEKRRPPGTLVTLMSGIKLVDELPQLWTNLGSIFVINSEYRS